MAHGNWSVKTTKVDLIHSMISAISAKYQVSLEVGMEAMKLVFDDELYTDSLLHALEIFLGINEQIIEAAKAKVKQ